MKRITDLARERTEEQLYEEVKGMSPEQREQYLCDVAEMIDEMLNGKFEYRLKYRGGKEE